MMEHIVQDGTYIPDTGIKYPEKPDDFILNPKIIYPVELDDNYPFMDNSFKSRLLKFGIYTGIFLLVFPVQKIRYGLKIVGKENIRKNRKYFKNGAVTVCNHVYRWDFLAVLQAVKYRRIWFPCRDVNVMTSDKNMIRGAGGIPIPSSLSAMRKFNAVFDELHSKKKWIHVFPETSRWEFYEPIRPFKLGGFKMAYKYQIPVIPFVISYREPKGIYKLLKVNHPLITLNVGTPVFPAKQENEDRNDVCLRMRKETHEQMVKMAGIKQNYWPCELD